MMIDHARVAQAFAQGGPLTGNDRFKISAGRRVTPGNVEIHERDTDIFYVQEGTATFVTGGTATGTKPSGPRRNPRHRHHRRHASRHLTKGDIIVIPRGIPHQFTEVSGTFLYFVVKVTK